MPFHHHLLHCDPEFYHHHLHYLRTLNFHLHLSQHLSSWVCHRCHHHHLHNSVFYHHGDLVFHHHLNYSQSYQGYHSILLTFLIVCYSITINILLVICSTIFVSIMIVNIWHSTLSCAPFIVCNSAITIIFIQMI